MGLVEVLQLGIVLPSQNIGHGLRSSIGGTFIAWLYLQQILLFTSPASALFPTFSAPALSVYFL